MAFVTRSKFDQTLSIQRQSYIFLNHFSLEQYKSYQDWVFLIDRFFDVDWNKTVRNHLEFHK